MKLESKAVDRLLGANIPSEAKILALKLFISGGRVPASEAQKCFPRGGAEMSNAESSLRRQVGVTMGLEADEVITADLSHKIFNGLTKAKKETK